MWQNHGIKIPPTFDCKRFDAVSSVFTSFVVVFLLVNCEFAANDNSLSCLNFATYRMYAKKKLQQQ